MELIEGQVYMSQKTREIAMEEYGEEVNIIFNNARSKLGECNKKHGRYFIRYSNKWIEANSKEKLLNLIIHEVAHIPYPNHKKVFKDECKKIAKKLGVVFKDKDYEKVPLNQYNYVYQCNWCREKTGRVRPMNPQAVHTPCYKILKSKIEIHNITKEELDKVRFKSI